MTEELNDLAALKLQVSPDGSSGVEIRAMPPEKFNCVEFTLRDAVPQTVLCSPWIQFMPTSMKEWIQKTALEIVRRANMHSSLLREIDDLKQQVENGRDSYDRQEKEKQDICAAWRHERNRIKEVLELRELRTFDEDLMKSRVKDDAETVKGKPTWGYSSTHSPYPGPLKVLNEWFDRNKVKDVPDTYHITESTLKLIVEEISKGV